MSRLPGASLIAHSGGPTAVINASLAGIVEETRRAGAGRPVFGARFGLEGMIADDVVDLDAIDNATIARMADAPSSVLGTSRRPASDEDLERVVAHLRARDIRRLFYTGGNGSMGTAARIGAAARAARYELSVIGVPKTIDNDLAVTDHAPGYGSAARFFAAAARDLGADNRALPGLVQVLEVLGRHAGWIAAATGLVRREPDDPPHLIYCPERPLPLARLLDDVQRVFDRLNRCLVVVCEGQLDERGEPFGADVRMSSRGPLATNLAHHIANVMTARLGLKARGEKPGLVGRVSAALRSDVDWEEARECGRAAVRAAAAGDHDVMVTLVRGDGADYRARTGLTPLGGVADVERRLPDEWIMTGAPDLPPSFTRYASPLVGPLASYPDLGGHRVS